MLDGNITRFGDGRPHPTGWQYTIDFVASTSTGCDGECYEFRATDTAVSRAHDRRWELPGSSMKAASGDRVSQACYPAPGVYPVRLFATYSWGVDSIVKYVQVGESAGPITVTNPVSLTSDGISDVVIQPSIKLPARVLPSDTVMFNLVEYNLSFDPLLIHVPDSELVTRVTAPPGFVISEAHSTATGLFVAFGSAGSDTVSRSLSLGSVAFQPLGLAGSTNVRLDYVAVSDGLHKFTFCPDEQNVVGQVTVVPQAVQLQLNPNLFSLRPNPASTSVQVTTPIYHGFNYNVRDVLGRTVQSGHLTTAGGRIALDALRSGVYIFDVVSSGLHHTLRLNVVR